MGKKQPEREVPLPERILQEEKRRREEEGTPIAGIVRGHIPRLPPQDECCVICGTHKEKFTPGSGKELNGKWICPDCVSQI